MSGDEVLVTIGSVVAALAAWGFWYAQLAGVRAWHPRMPSRKALALAPLACAGLILLVLATVASADVVNDPKYIAMYLVMGMAWAGVVAHCAPVLGVSYRHDALERGNQPAGHAMAGLLLGTAAAYAGGNVGNGPGWWVVVFCAALASAALLLGWMVLEIMTRISESITVERDHASGLRLMGFLIGAGLILGRAVAGDWVSAEAALHDFAVVAWPAVLLLGLAVALEMLYRPGPNRMSHGALHAGWVPALSYIGFGACHVLLYGMPAGSVE